MKENILVSSCLLGELVKYDGSHNKLEDILLKKLQDKYNIIPVCPEVEGGLGTPRTPCEIVLHNPLKIINKDGEDKTIEFINGANHTIKLAIMKNVKIALLKSNSPSCSNKYIYDGNFSDNKVIGVGITTMILEENEIKVYNEKEIMQIL